MKDWEKLLRDRKAWVYIKPNRYVHDSGFRCFETGYCTMNEKGTRIKEKLVLGEGSDHIQISNLRSGYLVGEVDINIDLTLDGYIRLFGEDIIWWGGGKWNVSSAYLQVLEKKD